MKKRILGMLLCVCMVLSLITVAAFADENYTITQNFKYGRRTYDGTDPQTSPYQFVIPAGGMFGLATIEDCAPYELVGWKESVSGTVYAPYAEIENLQSDLTFDAVYQVQGGLAVTVDGFMPGKTPDDCTYSFESTIPGVTFSADDILDEVYWEEYRFDGGGFFSEPINKHEAFKAGARYRIVISLNNKGLELAPSTTVNGIAPDYCGLPTNNGEPYALAIECDLDYPVAPTLAVTVDGFEVGKTPNDITYTFETTNMGVTFSEEDILANTGSWKYYRGEADEWLPMSKTEVFEAGTRYWCVINLDNKGLTVAPAVTMNGKTPEECYLATRDGTPCALLIGCDFGTPPAPSITISGPDVVCSQQDCEFSATAAEGAEISSFAYRLGDYGAETGWSRIEDGVCYGTVPASEYGDADSIELTVYGTAANGRPATATRTVRISPEHIYENGVCGCGAVREYTIEYVWGDAESTIPSGVKTHGVAFTLSSETFTRDGYIQTGWHDEYSREYELGGVYTLDENMMFFPVWEKLVTVTAPFTTTVALGDAGEPGETTFELALVDYWGDSLAGGNVAVTAAVTTDGAGDYSAAMTITGPEETLWYMLSESAFVQQVDAGADGWTVDDTVWGLLMSQAAALSDDAAAGYTLLVVPASVDEFGNYDIDWNAIDWEDPQSADMTFTNTYTAHAYALNHDADGHWDECAGCKDKQNAEPHKYGDWKVTKEATENAVGEKEHTCTVCGYTETAEIAKLPATTEPTNPDTKPETKPDTKPETKPDTKPDTKPATGTVQTGDDGFVLWAALFVTSGTLLAVLAPDNRRKKRVK